MDGRSFEPGKAHALPSSLSDGWPQYTPFFLKFESEEELELCSTIRQQNVLVIDDVTTSGSTLNEVLRTLRILNEDNEITIFSLIGRKDLMAEVL